MALLLVLFVAAATVLWLSVHGYLIMLGVLARGRRGRSQPVGDWPAVALVIPTLNEERTIAAKIADVARTDYPANKLQVVIVDGGSTDRTVDLVRAAIANGTRLELWNVDARGSKARQVNTALARLSQDFVVVSDADAALDPSCVRELVALLSADPHTAIVGASIRVATDLPEERLHWWGLNRLWWLEGDALSAAIVSGVCYAARRRAVAAAAHDARAEDAHFSLHSVAAGLGVRLSRTAWATEMRVPHDAQELLAFRRRRGADYLRELERMLAVPLPFGARVARWVRLFHFRVTPALVALAALSGAMLLMSPYWRWPLVAGLAFLLPPLLAVVRSRSLREIGALAVLVPAALRLAALLWMSIVTLRRSAVTLPAIERTPAASLVTLDPKAGS